MHYRLDNLGLQIVKKQSNSEYDISACCNATHQDSLSVEQTKATYFHVTNREEGKVDCFAKSGKEVRLIGTIVLPSSEQIVEVFYPSDEIPRAKHILLGICFIVL